MANDKDTIKKVFNVREEFDFDELERQLQEELEEELADIEFLSEQQAEIGDLDTLGQTILDTVWEQFTNQIAIQAGEDFIKNNNFLHLNLKDEAHIQTTDNFANGIIANHNTEIDYQQRYDEWQNNFQKNDDGTIRKTVKNPNRSSEERASLRDQKTQKELVGKDELYQYNHGYDARKYIDDGRPKGNNTEHMDHVISAAEIIRDPESAAHMSRSEQKEFANSEVNLVLLDARANESKSDSSMTEWLDSPRQGKHGKGQTQAEYWGLDEEELRERDRKAREEYVKQKKKAEKRSIDSGKKSQKAEALRIGKATSKAIVMNLFADLVKKIIIKMVIWLKTTNKNIKSLIFSIKDAIIDFVTDLNTKVVSVTDTAITVITTSILGPTVATIKKTWMFIKQGWSSLKEAVAYIRNTKNKNLPMSIMIMEVGKIVMAGVSGAGAIALGELVENGLSIVPVFKVEIPMFGSLANIIGIFMGAVIAGILGALAINLLNTLIGRKQKEELDKAKVDKKNAILATQEAMFSNEINRTEAIKAHVAKNISARHKEAGKVIKDSINKVQENLESDYEDIDNSNDLAEIGTRIRKLEKEDKNED